MCFGAFLQTEGNAPAIATKATVDAVRFVAELWKNGQDAASSLEPRLEQSVPALR